MILNRTYHVGVQKSTNQIDHVSRRILNVSPPIKGVWYPPNRPQQFYRKQGATFSNTTSESYKAPTDCLLCNSIRVGKSFKMMGKNDAGENKIPCCQSKGPVGSKYGNRINFSGNATIRSATTNVSPAYYSNYKSYLKSRGDTYEAKSSIHKISQIGIVINEKSAEILNCHDPIDSNEYYENATKCRVTIYKPNNSTFSCQGGVDSSSYIQRAKYNAITRNNASFLKPYGINLFYQENPLFFQKNNNYTCMVKQC